MNPQNSISSGVLPMDELLGGLFIGDNVVWHDDSGSLASVFSLNFIRASQEEGKPIIYISFDRSPRNLLEKLGSLSQYPALTLIDCFTSGKGASSPVFLKFYEQDISLYPCNIIQVKEPRNADSVTEILYGIHAGMEGDVRLVFESLTGMQELWGGEEHILNFYAHSCPRLYELNTVAYWIMEKKAHSQRLRAQITQIAQVVIDLTIKRGTTFLTVLKAERRDLDTLHNPHVYWAKRQEITFDEEKRPTAGVDLGQRLRELRTKSGQSQTELARLVGVTPSTISQVESNLIFPSLPALLKMAEVLSVDISSFFRERSLVRPKIVFSGSEASSVLPDSQEQGFRLKLLTPIDYESKAEPYLLEIEPEQSISSHFMSHKGEELGFVLSGKVQFRLEQMDYEAMAGDIICLKSETPSSWKNPGAEAAKLLWLKVK